MTVKEHSCLRRNQSGRRNPASLEVGEIRETLEAEARRLGLSLVEAAPVPDDFEGPDEIDAFNAGELDLPFYIEVPDDFYRERDGEALYHRAELDAAMRLGVAPPRWTRIYQARAATRQRRGPEHINYLVWHTPEGSEAGTLSVLNGTAAGFDLFTPLSGNNYKCNDWWNFVDWQAGDWPYNLASVGYEQGDRAANSGGWGDAFYRKLIYNCAWMSEVCSIPVKNGARGVPGFIDHAEITPGARTDPGAAYRRAFVLEGVADIRGGRVTPTDPIDPDPVVPAAKPEKPEKIYVVAKAGTEGVRVAHAGALGMKAMGVPASKVGVWTSPEDVRFASYKALKGRLGQFPCVVSGSKAVDMLHPDARANLRDDDGKWYPSDKSDLWDVTADMRARMRWRISTIAARLGLDAGKGLDAFEAELGKVRTR